MSKSISDGSIIKNLDCSLARLSQENSVEVDLKEIKKFVEQTVLLVEQVSNDIFYCRRFYEKWQKFIREKVSWKHLAHLQITKSNFRNVIEYIANKIRTLSQRPSPDTGKEWATTTKASSLEKKDVIVFEKKYNNDNQNSYGCRYGKYKPGNPVQQSGISLCSSSGGSKTQTSLHKKLILCKKNSKCAVSRKVKKLYRELENSDKRHRTSVVRGGLYNAISQNSWTEKHPKLSQIKS